MLLIVITEIAKLLIMFVHCGILSKMLARENIVTLPSKQTLKCNGTLSFPF